MRVAMVSPQRPTVGARSSQREDSPARPVHPTCIPRPMPCGDITDGVVGADGVCSDAARRVVYVGGAEDL